MYSPQYRAISDYGLIGNKLSAALVSTQGSIDWYCPLRFDLPSVFAAILDETGGGKFRISPLLSFESRQVYLPNTNILRTSFQTETGQVILTDFMPCYRGSDGRLMQINQVHRLVECSDGKVELEALFEPRPDYGREYPALVLRKYGVLVQNNPEPFALSSNVEFRLQGDAASSHFTLNKGEKAEFVLHSGEPQPAALYNLTDRLKKTRSYWEYEARGGTFYGLWRETILRSYLTLHLLIYQPAGAIIAAPTTSLPEEISGERNWDYRYAWLRDASLTLSAFSLMGHKDEAAGFMNWLSKVCSVRGPAGQTLHGIDFNTPPDEQTLDHLSGYRNSRPVRLGNAAYLQRQLDVFGEVLEAAYNYLSIRGYISRGTWQLLEAYVDSACRLWREPDSGIWEVRSAPSHFIHSKLMCWVALDRGIKIGEILGYRENLERWGETAGQIREDILSRGWNSWRGAFTQHYDTEALDASVLLIPLYGFLPASDERMVSTIARIREELGWNGLLRRYDQAKVNDGLKGDEGAFLACSIWLVRDLIRLNKLDEAVRLYERILKCANHLGLFSEMVNPDTGEAMGNFPQALTHLNIIIAGLELNQATLWGW
ncbi:MAG: glycoside hydrolase family 15 protein [Dehalococcoidales bacterium]|nr:glycoside hydrolase family 15 protein [Dehalococcoidales bacterium]